MSQQIYGFPFPMPPGIDYMEVSGLDVGFTGSITQGTSESFSFYMPLPGSISRLEQTIVVHAIEFILQTPHNHSDDQTVAMVAFLSSRGEVPALLDTISRTAAKDAFFKAQFARNIYFGNRKLTPTDTALAGPMQWDNDIVEDALYFPPAPLDQFSHPTHIHLFKQGVTIDPATQDETAVTFSVPTIFSMVVWFTPRNLTVREMDDRQQNASSRFAVRDA